MSSVAPAEGIGARPSMKERQWQLRESAILDAATELLKTKGFNAMTLEDITEAIGISRPTLYLHFKSKEDVATHVVIRNLCNAQEILDSLDPTEPPGERVRSFMRKAMERRFDKSHLAMYDLTRIKLSHAVQNPELRRTECRFMEGVTELVREAQEAGEVWAGIRPELLVLVIIGFTKNLEIDNLIAEGKTNRTEIEDALDKLLFDRVSK